MLEAMVCGTPVIAFPEGAACELVAPGETGFLVADEAEMAAACARPGVINAARCREHVVERCNVRCVARAYEDVYRRVARPGVAPRGRGGPGLPASSPLGRGDLIGGRVG